MYCLPVSICIAGGLLHFFTSADVVAAGKLVVDFDEHAINGTNMATNAKNRRSNFGYFIVPPKSISLVTNSKVTAFPTFSFNSEIEKFQITPLITSHHRVHPGSE
jgi:hypothetical protein